MLYLDQIIRYYKRIDWNLDMIDSKYSRSRLWCVWCAEEE